MRSLPMHNFHPFHSTIFGPGYSDAFILVLIWDEDVSDGLGWPCGHLIELFQVSRFACVA